MILIGAFLLGAAVCFLIPFNVGEEYVVWMIVGFFCVADAFFTELNVYLAERGGTHVFTRIIFSLAFAFLILFLGKRSGYDLCIVVLIPFAIRLLNNINQLKDHISDAAANGGFSHFHNRQRTAGEGE